MDNNELNNTAENNPSNNVDTTAADYTPKFDAKTGQPINPNNTAAPATPQRSIDFYSNHASGGADQTAKNPSKPTTESIIGKYILPICAALMILAGICYFAITLWENIPDGFKALIIAGLGLVVGAIGFSLRKKENLAIFKTILIAIALAILYVDTIVMYTTWYLIPELVFALIIVVWCIVCILLGALLKQQIYHFCSMTGVIVSGFFWASSVCGQLSDFIICWTFAITFCLIAVSYKKIFKRLSFIFGISGTILIITILVSIIDHMDYSLANIMELFIKISGFLFAILFALFYRFIAIDNYEKVKDVEKILQFFEIVILGVILTFFNSASDDFSYINLAAVILFCLAACVPKANRNFTIFAIILPLGICCMQVSDQLCDQAYPGLILLTGVILIVFLFCDKLVMRIISIISLSLLQFLGMFLYSDGTKAVRQYKRISNPARIEELANTINTALVFVIVAAVIAICFQLIFLRRKVAAFYSPATAGVLIQLIICAITLNKIMVPYGENFLPYGISMVVAFICLILFEIRRHKDITDKKVPFDLYIQPAIFNLAATILYIECDSVAMMIVLGVLVFASIVVLYFGSGIRHRLNSGSLAALMSVIYLDYFILISSADYFSDGFLFTAGMLLIAAAYIIFGFIKRTKVTRIYGLISMLVSIAKMMLLDINTDKTPVRVASLIGGGIVCLIISFIYFKLEKKLVDEAQ